MSRNQSDRVCFYKLLQVVDVIKVKNARAAMDAEIMLNNIASVIPEVQYPIESTLRHPEAVQNVHKREKVTLVKPDGSHFQIPQYLAEWHCRSNWEFDSYFYLGK